MVIEMFKKLMAIFNRKQKIHLLFLGVMIFIGGIVETLGVSAMLPVISVILDQESLQEYEIVGTVMDLCRIETMQSFTMFLLGLLIGVYVLKNLYTVWLTYEQNRFITVNKNKMISQVLREFLNRPYEFYLDCGYTHGIPDDRFGYPKFVPIDDGIAAVCIRRDCILVFGGSAGGDGLENGVYDGRGLRGSNDFDE